MALHTFLLNFLICFIVFSISHVILNWLLHRSEPLRIKNALTGAIVFAIIYSVGVYLLSIKK